MCVPTGVSIGSVISLITRCTVQTSGFVRLLLVRIVILVESSATVSIDVDSAIPTSTTWSRVEFVPDRCSRVAGPNRADAGEHRKSLISKLVLVVALVSPTERVAFVEFSFEFFLDGR